MRRRSTVATGAQLAGMRRATLRARFRRAIASCRTCRSRTHCSSFISTPSRLAKVRACGAALARAVPERRHAPVNIDTGTPQPPPTRSGRPSVFRCQECSTVSHDAVQSRAARSRSPGDDERQDGVPRHPGGSSGWRTPSAPLTSITSSSATAALCRTSVRAARVAKRRCASDDRCSDPGCIAARSTPSSPAFSPPKHAATSLSSPERQNRCFQRGRPR